jgi:hypothetical protein
MRHSSPFIISLVDGRPQGGFFVSKCVSRAPAWPITGQRAYSLRPSSLCRLGIVASNATFSPRHYEMIAVLQCVHETLGLNQRPQFAFALREETFIKQRKEYTILHHPTHPPLRDRVELFPTISMAYCHLDSLRFQLPALLLDMEVSPFRSKNNPWAVGRWRRADCAYPR